MIDAFVSYVQLEKLQNLLFENLENDFKEQINDEGGPGIGEGWLQTFLTRTFHVKIKVQLSYALSLMRMPS